MLIPINLAKTSLTGLSLVTLLACSSPADELLDDMPNALPHAATYRDGQYTATGEYGNLPSHITVTLTLRRDTITTVRVQPHATDPTSLDLQQRFAAAVPQVVIGKPINEVNVGRLAGSSGTPKGFNDAIAQIKKQAVQP